MNLIPKLFFKFVNSTKSFQQVLTPHIYKIIQQDELNTVKKYESCKIYFSRIMQQCSNQQSKIKCNMIFNISNVSDSLLHLKPVMWELVVDNSIRSQYELDQVIKWLIREIKVNKEAGREHIVGKLSKRNEEPIELQEQLLKLSQQETSIDMNQICKQLRQKYFTIDSKVIFQRVNKLMQNNKTATVNRKDNKLWDKLLDIKPRSIKQECNSKEVYDQHLQITGGRPRFRFPPEPNGYLHIGHVKSIRINFESAKRMGGTCFLRYDDTNPDKQTYEFIQQIQDNVKWLGYTPDKITFASDYFEQIMHYANSLIKSGHAYVCDSTREHIQTERKNKQVNPYRQRSIEESLRIFPNLAANQTLRLKGIPDSANPTLRDPIIYRLKQKPHPRTGNKFKIYPMYDFTHCISDSIEHIDYSLCSLQFQIRRQLYYTILDMLGLYKPVVWQYSRLNIEGNVLSKRKIKELIEKGSVEGWSDPRLLTIRGLQNRGYTPDMLKQFIDKVNCSRSGNQNVVQFSLLQKQMKKVLLVEAPKAMGVIHPYSAIFQNYGEFQGYEKQNWIQIQDAGKLQKGNQIILKNAGVFQVLDKTVNQIVFKIVSLSNVSQTRKSNPNIKIIHWISQSQSISYKVVLYDKLLDEKGEFNPQSKQIVQNTKMPKSISKGYIQLERIGFFKLSDDGKQLRLCSRI